MDKHVHPSQQRGANCCACCQIGTSGPWFNLKRNADGSYFQSPNGKFLLPVNSAVYSFAPYVCNACREVEFDLRLRLAKRASAVPSQSKKQQSSLAETASSSAPTAAALATDSQTKPQSASNVKVCCSCGKSGRVGPWFGLARLGEAGNFMYTRLRNEEFLLKVDDSLYNFFPYVCNKCNDEHIALTNRRANGVSTSRPSPIIEVLDDDDTSFSSVPLTETRCPMAVPSTTVAPVAKAVTSNNSAHKVPDPDICCACGKFGNIGPWFAVNRGEDGSYTRRFGSYTRSDGLYVRTPTEKFRLDVDDAIYDVCPYVCNSCNDGHILAKFHGGAPDARPSREVLDDSSSSAPPAKRQCLAAVPDDTPSSPPTPTLTAAETADLVKTFMAIGEARSRTRTMIATVQKFLSLRASLTDALAPVTTDALDIDDFMLMQESFVQMLYAQLEAIKTDHRAYADKLALANKSNEES